MFWTSVLLADLAVFLAATRRKQGPGWRLARGAPVITTVVLVAVFEFPPAADLRSAVLLLIAPAFAPDLRTPLVPRALLAAAFLVGAFTPPPHWSVPFQPAARPLPTGAPHAMSSPSSATIRPAVDTEPLPPDIAAATDRALLALTGCIHAPQCPGADAPDRYRAHTMAAHPEQGWSLLCNGVIVFDDLGAVLPHGQLVAAQAR